MGDICITLKTLERCGIVALKESRTKTQPGGRTPVKPVVLAERFDFEFVLQEIKASAGPSVAEELSVLGG